MEHNMGAAANNAKSKRIKASPTPKRINIATNLSMVVNPSTRVFYRVTVSFLEAQISTRLATENP